MKNLLTLFSFLLTLSSFGQSYTYDAFLLGESNAHLTAYPVPLTIKNIGDGEYVITAEGFEGRLSINDTLYFDMYNEWDDLYRYKGLLQRITDGGPQYGGRVEINTYMTVTTKKKLSEFSKGLNISTKNMNDDYKINYENKIVHTVSSSKSSPPVYKDTKITHVTIVPYMNRTN